MSPKTQTNIGHKKKNHRGPGRISHPNSPIKPRCTQTKNKKQKINTNKNKHARYTNRRNLSRRPDLIPELRRQIKKNHCTENQKKSTKTKKKKATTTKIKP